MTVSRSEHPYAQRLIAELTHMLDEGWELPFVVDDINQAADLAYISGAAEIARRDEHYLLAWLLARFYRELKSDYRRWDE